MKRSQNKPWCCRSCTVWHRLHKARPLGSCTQSSMNKLKLAGDGTSVESAVSGPTAHHLVMQVRVLTEAPLPQLREQTDQPPHVAHSFLK